MRLEDVGSLAPLQLHKQGDVITTNAHRMQLSMEFFAFYFYAETVCAVGILVPSTLKTQCAYTKKNKDMEKWECLIDHLGFDRWFLPG